MGFGCGDVVGWDLGVRIWVGFVGFWVVPLLNATQCFFKRDGQGIFETRRTRDFLNATDKDFFKRDAKKAMFYWSVAFKKILASRPQLPAGAACKNVFKRDGAISSRLKKFLRRPKAG